jgi:hypothetical protein
MKTGHGALEFISGHIRNHRSVWALDFVSAARASVTYNLKAEDIEMQLNKISTAVAALSSQIAAHRFGRQLDQLRMACKGLSKARVASILLLIGLRRAQ